MISGRLRTRITWQNPPSTIADNGERTGSWTTFNTVWCELRSISGQEYLKNDRIQGDITHQIRIRYLSGLLDKMRGVVGSKIYEIVAILPDRTEKRNQVVMVKELAA